MEPLFSEEALGLGNNLGCLPQDYHIAVFLEKQFDLTVDQTGHHFGQMKECSVHLEEKPKTRLFAYPKELKRTYEA